MSKFSHRHHTNDEMRDRAVRLAHQAAGHAICGRTRSVPGAIPTDEVCVRWPAHEGPCFDWSEHE